jgi:hypothetical protein
LHAQEHAAQGHGGLLVVVFGVEIAGVSRPARHGGGIIDQHIQPAKGLNHGFDHGGDLVLLADIGVNRHHGLSQFDSGLLLSAADVDGCNPGTLAHEHPGASPTDATPSPGDDGHLSLQQTGHQSASPRWANVIDRTSTSLTPASRPSRSALVRVALTPASAPR